MFSYVAYSKHVARRTLSLEKSTWDWVLAASGASAALRPVTSWGSFQVHMRAAGRILTSAAACRRLPGTGTMWICFGLTPATVARGAAGMSSPTSFAIQRNALPALRRGHPHLILPRWPGILYSLIYSFENDTVLSAAAQMRFHGWPFGWTPLEFSENGLRSLSGDCYSVPWATAMQLALWLNPFSLWCSQHGPQ